MNLTHLDKNNRPKMVDVSNKENTTRIAIASGLISMSHPVLLSGINCDVNQLNELPGFKLTVTTKLLGQTGVTIGLLTIYDMVKEIDKNMIINNVQLEYKSGGNSGDFNRGGEK